MRGNNNTVHIEYAVLRPMHGSGYITSTCQKRDLAI